MAIGAHRIIIVTKPNATPQIFAAGNSDRKALRFLQDKRKDFPEEKGYEVRLFKQIRTEGDRRHGDP